MFPGYQLFDVRFPYIFSAIMMLLVMLPITLIFPINLLVYNVVLNIVGGKSTGN